MTLIGAIILTMVLSFLPGLSIAVPLSVYKHDCRLPVILIFMISTILIYSVGIPLEINCYISQFENIVYEIKSLKSEVGTSGKFYLGYGNMNVQAYYFFYVQHDKGYSLKNTPASCTYINVLEESKYTIPVLTKKKNKGEWDSYYVIYVPQHYIEFEFKI